MTHAHRHVVRWLLDHPAEAVPLGCRLEDCDFACHLVDLGIASRSEDGGIVLRSAVKAQHFLKG